LIGFTLGGTTMALAQQATDEAEEVVVIGAPITRQEEGRSYTGMPKEVIELKRQISYADLDLTKDADVQTLQTRIHDVAEESCQKLAEMFPLKFIDQGEVGRCVDDAVASSKDQVQAAIDAAG